MEEGPWRLFFELWSSCARRPPGAARDLHVGQWRTTAGDVSARPLPSRQQEPSARGRSRFDPEGYPAHRGVQA